MVAANGWFLAIVLFVAQDGFSVAFSDENFLENITISCGVEGRKCRDDNYKTPLYILGFFPLQSPMLLLAKVSKISAELALEHINNDDTILKDFELRMIVKNSKDDEGYAVNSLFAIKTYYEPNILMVIGPLRNELSESLGRVINYWKIPMISYGSHSPLLTNEIRYSKFYRTIPSSLGMNIPRVRMMQAWGWTYVASVSSNGQVFNMMSQDLAAGLSAHNITLLIKDSFDNDPLPAIELLKEKDARIIVGNFYEFDAVKVFCEAFKLGFYGPEIVWILYGHFEQNWWEPLDLEQLGCSGEDMLAAIEGHFAVQLEVLGDDQVEAVGGITPQEYSNYIKNVTGVDLELSPKPAPYAYDAVIAAALAINASYETLGKSGLENFSNLTGDEASELNRNLDDTQFDGVSGRVTFDVVGDRQGTFKITRFVKGKYIDIARYTDKDEYMQWHKNKSEIWGTEPPPDRQSTEVHEDKVSLHLFIVMSCISFVGVLTATAFLVFNIYYRNERLIKMSSPNLNNLIIIGCIMCYVTIILLGIESRRADGVVICQIRTWIFTVSFTLSFGAMFSKTWRVYSIFTNKNMQKRVIKDHRLFVMVGVLLLIDVVLLLAWEVFARPTIVNTTIKEYRHTENPNLVIKITQNRCVGLHEEYFTGIILVYKGLLLIFGTFITWQTRNVSIPALNDSRFIGLCIYNVVIFSSLGVPLSILLAENSDNTYGIIGGLIIFCTTLTLCLLFLPKVASIVQGYAPEDVGSRVMSNMNGRSSRGYSQGPPSRIDEKPTCTNSVTLEPPSDVTRTTDTRSQEL